MPDWDRSGNTTESAHQGQMTALRAELDQAVGVIADRNKQLADLLKVAATTDEQISAVYRAFGAPGDYGYESREGKALYALYLSQNALRAAMEQCVSSVFRVTP